MTEPGHMYTHSPCLYSLINFNVMPKDKSGSRRLGSTMEHFCSMQEVLDSNSNIITKKKEETREKEGRKRIQ